MTQQSTIDSAVDFLRDPSHASTPLEQKILFLRSNNLTPEEVDISLARAVDTSYITQKSPALVAPQPSYGQPHSGQPNFGQPNYGQLNSGQPSSGQPNSGQPSFGQPNSAQPNYGQPNFGQPNYGQPNSGQLNSGQPNSGQPNFGQPNNFQEPNNNYPGQNVTGQPAFQPYQGNPWGQPPELPRHDWRDWFIAATISTSLSYGLYVAAKRYILPLILPPTPSQIAADKASIDESFARAFALIDQLAADTESLKSSEAERTDKLETTLQDVEVVISDLKEANLRREAESKALGEQVRGINDVLPKVLDSWESGRNNRLNDLGGELRGLKKLLGAKMGGGIGPQASVGRVYPNLSGKDKPSASGAISRNIAAKGAGEFQDSLPGSPAPAPGVKNPEQEVLGGNRSSSKTSTPAWQMAGETSIGESSSIRDGTLAERETSGEYQISKRSSIPAWQVAGTNEKNINDSYPKAEGTPAERETSGGYQIANRSSIPVWQTARANEKSPGEAPSKENENPMERKTSGGYQLSNKGSIPAWQLAGASEKNIGEAFSKEDAIPAEGEV